MTKWKCPRCKRWIEEPIAKLCKWCTAGSDDEVDFNGT